MMVTYLASIEWISFEDGGRKNPLKEGINYCPLIELNDISEKENWSIIFTSPDCSKTNTIRFKFLSKNAPQDSIKVSGDYYIFEGAKRVARLHILKIIDEIM